MIKYYQHKQIGYLSITVLSCALLLAVYSVGKYAMKTQSINLGTFLIVFIVGVSAMIFVTLTTSIVDDVVEIQFGLKIVRKKFCLNDIESCQILNTPWYYGWGIHLTPYGWIYNVSGSHGSVNINMKTGKKYLIGTDVPDELLNAIEKSIERIS